MLAAASVVYYELNNALWTICLSPVCSKIHNKYKINKIYE